MDDAARPARREPKASTTTSCTREEFERLRDAGGFLEWFEVYGDLKGTPRQFVVDALAAGHDVLLELDVQGALAVRERAAGRPAGVRAGAVPRRAAPPARGAGRRRSPRRSSGGWPGPRPRKRIAASASTPSIVNDDVGRAAAELAAIVEARRSGAR